MRLVFAVLVSATIVFAVLVMVSFGAHGRLASPFGKRPAVVRDMAPRPSAPILIEQGVGGCGGCL